MGPTDQEPVEGCREGVGVGTPKGPLGQEPVATGAVLDLLWDTRVGYMVTNPRGKKEENSETGCEGRAGTTLGCMFFLFLVSFLCLLLFFFCPSFPLSTSFVPFLRLFLLFLRAAGGRGVLL